MTSDDTTTHVTKYCLSATVANQWLECKTKGGELYIHV